MDWTISYSNSATKELRKLDRTTSRRIVDYMERVSELDNPRLRGKPLVGQSREWSYRVGSYRVICDIQDERLTILALRIGRRDEVFR